MRCFLLWHPLLWPLDQGSQYPRLVSGARADIVAWVVS